VARSQAKLRVVGKGSPTQPDPDSVLRDLFAVEADLQALADANRRLIGRAIDAYARHHDLLARPRVELLRTRFAPLRKRIGTGA
jgi:hypothetical protein